ncbi:MAG: bifunctional 4-hydroxy-3-methylbut-2-enyl diphosphate reductase/30S ribosomal protein S1 [Oscillospiraceae bacterium]|nr:bifunctional 4-hydroxy-3-methylbut-2-enyl diphosphate reductase/30S ribosomal protein S1 [Oscillospiraceae bacterium]
MSIKIAETAGFCYGVKRAVDEVYRLAENKKTATLGELIHNKQVIADLAERGVRVYHSPEDFPKDTAAVIRTHGVGSDVIAGLEKNNIDIIDLTCPFVAKIHKIAGEHYRQGYTIVIVGDKEHPEVKGINGHCEYNAVILYDPDDVPYIKNLSGKKICIVAQTTINREKFVKAVEYIKRAEPSALVFDTICNATKERQTEAQKLSSESDIMIVVGGKHSSNTRKLYEISAKNCPQTFSIETFEDMPQNVIYKNKKIGITAGASTPRCIIEEVYTKMEEKMNSQEEQFAELLEQHSLKTLNTGDIVTGKVAEIKGNEVVVDLGFKSDGIITLDNLTDDSNAKPEDLVKVGDDIKVYVVGVNDAEGKVVLSRKKVAAMENWKKLEEAYEAKSILEGKITTVVKGGVMVATNGSSIFVPARQVSERFVSDLQTLINNDVRLRIIDFDKNKRRVIGSVRSVLEDERKAREEAFWSAAEAGKEYTGAVKSITNFGAFVDLGGVDGLVHISELSWNKIKHPSEVVKEGDVLTVYIKDMDRETKKISLGYKKQEDNPWVIAQNKYNINDVIDVKIVRMMPFGAFAEILPGVDGLIHISQIADRRIGKPEDVLQTGQTVTVKITDINWENKKISLSIRALIQAEADAADAAAADMPEAVPVEIPTAEEETPASEDKTDE